jgi:hypothetical protein
MSASACGFSVRDPGIFTKMPKIVLLAISGKVKQP